MVRVHPEGAALFMDMKCRGRFFKVTLSFTNAGGIRIAREALDPGPAQR
jgi:hypothetical protein